MVKLIEVAEVIRSKNSGPYELTLDIIFRDHDIFQKVWARKVFTKESIAELYGIEPSTVLRVIPFPPAKAIKINLQRPIPSGDLGETDVYGAQQHAPLLDMKFTL
ncbi:MAG TPA: DUF4387 domain-containing protein [Firmicutes bacterium]|nr:DUF4387 domain-containing protein [Bacillota bacterium]